MDDHFWPALYPAIALGLLLGLTGGSIVSTLLGGIGGLAGAAALYFAFASLGMQDSAVSFLGLLGGAAGGAYVLIKVWGRVTRARASIEKE
jgi:hypothetical protein